MKTLLFLILIAIAAYVYFNFIVENNVKVKDHLVFSRSSSFDVNDFSYSSNNYAFIEGNLNNISGQYLSNIVLTYVIGIDTIVTYISRVSPNNVVNFRTSSFMIRNPNYNYSLEDISYDLESDTK